MNLKTPSNKTDDLKVLSKDKVILLFERFKDVKKLYVAVLIIFAPFIIYFLIVAHERFAGFFKAFGMMGGLTLIAFLEEKGEPLSYDVAWWKKLLRIVIGVALAFALKEGLKIFETGGVYVDLVLDALRYFVVVFAVGFLCPLLFKKIKLYYKILASFFVSK